MGVIRRQGIWESLISYLGIGLGMVSMLWIYPQAYSTEELGLVRFLIDIPVVVVPVLALCSGDIAIRYFPRFRDKARQHNGLLFFVLSLALAGFLIFLLSGLLFQNTLDGYFREQSALQGRFWVYILPLALFSLLSWVMTAYCVNFSKLAFPSVLHNIVLKAGLMCLAVLYWKKYIGMPEMVWGLLLLYATVLAGMFVYLAVIGELNLRPDFGKFDSTFVRDLRSFWGVQFMATLLFVLATRIDILVLATFSTLSNTAVFSFGNFIATVIDVPKKSLDKAMLAPLMDALAKDDLNKVEILYKQTSINQLVAGIALFACIWSSIDYLYAIMEKGADYAPGKWIVLMIGIGRLFDMATGINSHILGFSKFYKAHLYILSIMALVNIALNYFLINAFGMNGVGAATMIALILYNLLKMWYIWSKWRIQPFTRQTFLTVLVAAAACLLCALLPDFSHPLANIVVNSLLFAVFYWGISPDMRAFGQLAVQKLKKRF
jgi:O-antigen/teichoic acid export membrane protein